MHNKEFSKWKRMKLPQGCVAFCCSLEGKTSHELSEPSESVISWLFIPDARSGANLDSVKSLFNNSLHSVQQLKIECTCQNGSGALKDALLPAYSQQSGSSYSESASKERRALPGWDRSQILDLLTEAGFLILKGVSGREPNWETQSEPWRTPHALFGLLLSPMGTPWYRYLQATKHTFGAQIWRAEKKKKKKKKCFQGPIGDIRRESVVAKTERALLAKVVTWNPYTVR